MNEYTDHQLLASGDKDIADIRAPLNKVDPNTETECKRCGQPNELFSTCRGCVELDKMLCQCNHTLKRHWFSIGSRTHARFWHCQDCNFKPCVPLSDPIKQEKIVKDLGLGLHRVSYKNKENR